MTQLDNQLAIPELQLDVPVVHEDQSVLKAQSRALIKDKVIAALFALAAVAIAIPLISLLWTVVSRGLARIDAEFFTSSMKGVVGAGGGALHAIVGTLEITGLTLLVSVPIGIAAAVFLTEYAAPGSRFASCVRFLVDVMTGIPSIVAGLFAYSLFSLVLGPAYRSGIAAALALSLLMLPVVIRSTEEVLLLVPHDLREAGWALGAEKHTVIWKVVLPAALPGVISGVLNGVARIIGETAPLLLVSGFADAMNYNPLEGRMASLPVYIYTQWQMKGLDAQAYDDRAWSAALVLIAVVAVLALAARLAPRLLKGKK
ncbi:MAG: phosphate ABC transporter permease PstA [Propionibacteriaceae bacterium]|jgi:phosphate transport system permease protein|nr:phosphate ABC transporter permease PstA [Propionibacteriaceae bacterium]